jgi:tRNA-2-methylthio-N6-dimethylallyladenosine synthase
LSAFAHSQISKNFRSNQQHYANWYHQARKIKALKKADILSEFLYFCFLEKRISMDNLIKDIDIISAEEAQVCDFKTTEEQNTGKSKKLYIESYGCAMNFSDSEIVASIMKENGFDTTSNYEIADVIFLNTCSIREKAEQTVRKRISQFNKVKKKNPELTIGVLGCMAERLKEKLLEEEKLVDVVVGPDAYRDLPNLISAAEDGIKGINTFLSREETYADIAPVRLNSNGVSAYISIMRGCDNMCSFCVVPFTRGRERSRDPFSIVKEAQDLFAQGYREVTLLGQNVDSYKWSPEENNKQRLNKKEGEVSEVVTFDLLLEMVALVDPKLRVRFSTSHPKDITDEVLHTIKKYENICNYIHLPAQSGNSRVLELMNRTYDREWYLERVSKIREIIGEECGISSDMITGFCSETEEEHRDTLSLMDSVKFDFSYMFFYSERPGTLAAKKYPDDIPLEVKKRRLAEVIEKQSQLSLERNKLDIGKEQLILIEGASKKSDEELKGKNSANKVVIISKGNYKIGDYVKVKITDCTPATLFGEVIDTNPILA